MHEPQLDDLTLFLIVLIVAVGIYCFLTGVA
ncbi:hypothetical protein LCGC14_0163700 [marine sediment metagenome]|uniref:Uncharacterized protein n=1 Tax=marine sediment metagenome TaxID=412755 RepID=A0A0F9XCK4_9ZZZZ